MGLEKGYQRNINQKFSIHIAENNKKEELQQILELNVNVHRAKRCIYSGIYRRAR